MMVTRFRGMSDRNWLRAGVAALALTLSMPVPSAFALSELQREDIPVPQEGEGADTIIREQLPPPPSSEEQAQPDSETAPEGEDEAGEDAGGEGEADEVRPPRVVSPVPLPDPIVAPRDTRPAATEETGDVAEPEPQIHYDLSILPEPVRQLRDKIMEACRAGDIEKLRPLLSTGSDATQISFGNVPGDPIEFLRSVSGDGQGHEILAILYEVLDSGFVIEQIDDAQMYIWPYFYSVSLDSLTPAQRVELFKLVTAGDYEDMKNFGGYIFYRVGISPEGHWQFFVAGD